MARMKVEVAPNFLNGAVVENLNLNINARNPPGNSVGGRHGGGGSGDDGGGSGRGRCNNDSDKDDEDEAPRKGLLRCGHNGGNRGRGEFAGNPFWGGGRGMGPSVGHPAPTFFAPMFRARDVRQDSMESRRKWDEDDMTSCQPKHVDLACGYRMSADDGGVGAPNPGRPGDVSGTGGIQGEQKENGGEDWHSEASTAMDTEEEWKLTRGLDSYNRGYGRPVYNQLLSPSPPAQTDSYTNREQVHEGSQTASIDQVPTHTSWVQRPRTSLQAAGQGLAFVSCHKDLKNSLRSQRSVEPHIRTQMQRTNEPVKGLQDQLHIVPERTQSPPNFEVQQGSAARTNYRSRLHPIHKNPLTQLRSSNEDRQRAKVALEGVLRYLEPVSMRTQDFQTLQNDTDNEYQQAPVSSHKYMFEQTSSSAQPASRRLRNDAMNASGTQPQLPSQPQPQIPDDKNEDASRDPHPPLLKRWTEHYDGPAWLDETSTSPSSSSTPPAPTASTVENPASRLNDHSCLSPSTGQYFEHAPPLALRHPEVHVQHHDSQYSSFFQPEISTDHPPTANIDAQVDALLVKAQESSDNLQGSGSSQQSQKKRYEWETVPPPLNIVQKKPTRTHAQCQTAAGLNNNFEANTSLLQHHQRHPDLLWQREQEKQTPQKTYCEGDTRVGEIVEGTKTREKGKEPVGEV
jgi:hypothetical protein